MDFSSFPHRQVVFRAKTTIVWTRVCSFDFLPRVSPMLLSQPTFQTTAFHLNFCSILTELLLRSNQTFKGFFSGTTHVLCHSIFLVYPLFDSLKFCKVLWQNGCLRGLQVDIQLFLSVLGLFLFL
jgi:hypothetical protein